MSKKKKKKYYLIIKGHKSGLYTTWFGTNGAAEQVQGYADAVYKGFYTKEESIKWLGKFKTETLRKYAPNLLDLVKELPNSKSIVDNKNLLEKGKLLVYTDGGATPNPGPGGYGVVIRNKEKRKELSGGFRLTTNNRMEILACIKGLESLTEKSNVVLFSDSQYVVNAIEKGWAKNWRAKNWKAPKGELRRNHDLWKKLLSADEKHDVEFRWVKGHAGNMDNERCDQLASQMAKRKKLPIDEGYEIPRQTTQMLL